MSADHLILCGGTKLTSRQRQWREAKTVELRVGKDVGNVNLRISDLTDKLIANLSEIELDLLEIATYVYCADQATCRGGLKRIDYGEAWYRGFRFEIPVRQPDFWASEEVNSDLCRCLNDLSGDNFEFAFAHQPATSSHLEYFEFGDNPATDVEEVLLFSGGLDSFGGAVDEILGQNRKVALVSHRANPKIDARQKQLVRDLTSKVEKRIAPTHVPVLVQKINKEKDLNKEYTQRTRSFLYTSIASIVARLFGLQRIRFYENGVTSLNLPISPQVVSTRATRSTHPKPLARICSLLSRVYPKGFGIENRFFGKTKTDVLEQIKQAGHSSMCATTVSCAHTWEMSTPHPHCGKCSQCVDRRLSALAAGYSTAEDPPDQYRFNLFADGLDKPLDRTLVESYVEVINRIQRCDTATNFCVEFPELSRVINFIPGLADDTAKAIFDLYKRHARQIGGAIDAQGRAAFSQLRLNDLPANSLIRIVASGIRPLDGQTASKAPAGHADEAEGLQGDGKQGTPPPVMQTDPNAYLNPKDLAARYEVDHEALRKRLERWRETTQDGWKEIDDRRRNESKYLYQVKAVLPIIDDLRARRASGKTSGKRPTENNSGQQ